MWVQKWGKHTRRGSLRMWEERAVITVGWNGTTNKRMKNSTSSNPPMITQKNGNMQIWPPAQYSITTSINLIPIINYATVWIVTAVKIQINSHSPIRYKLTSHRQNHWFKHLNNVVVVAQIASARTANVVSQLRSKPAIAATANALTANVRVDAARGCLRLKKWWNKLSQ